MNLTGKWLEKLSQTEYRRHTEYISYSDIKTILENPFEFLNKQEEPKSESMLLGSVIHSLILEKDNFFNDFLVMENVDLRTKDGKAKKQVAEVRAKNFNATLIKQSLYDKALEVVNAFENSKAYNMFKCAGLSEASYFGEIEGKKCKCRPDFYMQNENIILDIKTTAKGGAMPDAFIKNIAKHKYYIQAALYTKLTGAKDFYFVAIETEAPYMIGIYKLDNISLEFGMNEIRRAFSLIDNLDKFKDNIYKDVENDFNMVQSLTLPNYVYYQKGASYGWFRSKKTR